MLKFDKQNELIENCVLIHEKNVEKINKEILRKS